MIKALIIGYGSIGERHSTVLSGNMDVRDIALVTSRKVRNFQTYPMLEDVPDLDSYDYFILSSETWKHYGQLSYLVKRLNDKTILVEKPLFERSGKLKTGNNRVYVGYNLRFHPVLRKMREWTVKQDVLFAGVMAGQYLPSWRPGSDYRHSYSASVKKGGGVLLDLSHELDYIQWIFGKIGKIAAIDRKVSDLEIETDDLATMIGTTEKDIVINLTVDYISKEPVRQIIVHTKDKTCFGDMISGRCWIHDGKERNEVVLPSKDRNETYIQMHRAVLDGRGDQVCTYQEGLSVMELIGRIKKHRVR